MSPLPTARNQSWKKSGSHILRPLGSNIHAKCGIPQHWDSSIIKPDSYGAFGDSGLAVYSDTTGACSNRLSYFKRQIMDRLDGVTATLNLESVKVGSEYMIVDGV